MTLQLIHGDCLEAMATLPAASVDLVLADLPYGTTQNKWDSVIPLDALWAQYWRQSNGPVNNLAQTAAGQGRNGSGATSLGMSVKSETLGWQPTCDCNAGVTGGTVLDPFGGAGTTALVANELGRNALLVELNPDYAILEAERIRHNTSLRLSLGRVAA